MERIEEGVREIGVLLVALAPLDAALMIGSSEIRVRALKLAPLGLLLFSGAVFHEWRRHRVR